MPLELRPPYPLMEAVSVQSLPEGDQWQYEPKWDGFRCLAFKDGDRIELQSKAQKLLTRCFPEIVEALNKLKPKAFVLDGELVVPVEGNLSFDQLLLRLTPSATRAKALAKQHPALFLVFDLLADEQGKTLVGEPLEDRRGKLEAFAKKHLGDSRLIQLSPATRSLEVAGQWLDGLVGGSLDGVVAKRLDLPYQQGASRAMQKVKRRHTVDCVVGGVLYTASGDAVSGLLLGLYEDGLLNFVGSCPLKAIEGKKLASEISRLIKPPGFTGTMPHEGKGRFGREIREWQPLATSLVVEVQFDHFTGGRFRHGAKFLRWRPDKKAKACTINQIIGAREE